MAEAEMIFTTEGMVPIAELEQRTIRMAIPCGFSVAHEYYKDGRLVRRDITIEAQPDPINFQ